jgi:1,4-alpha-glucan branching enzyme/maltooligosyltrehalose trehalohydrolase
MRLLGRCLTEGFAYQGEASRHRGNRPRGEPSRRAPCTAFVSFLQNHDQVGNRACGERITLLAPEPRVRAALAILLLAPQPPLLFMGQEWGCRQPFPFFSDFGPGLGAGVTEGRRAEFAAFSAFSDPDSRRRIPDPQLRSTFDSAVLDWSRLERGAAWLELHRRLLTLRHRLIVPRLRGVTGEHAAFELPSPRVLHAHWRLADGDRLILIANLGDEPAGGVAAPQAPLLYTTGPSGADVAGRLAPWSVFWYLGEPEAAG